jgi:protein tyrosine phosphatase
MRQFIQTTEDRDKERNNCRMDDYADNFIVGTQFELTRYSIVQKVRLFEVKNKLEQKEAKRPENITKNRYIDILPCELNGGERHW